MNLKKILTSVFAAAICVCAMSVSAFAEGEVAATIGETEYATIAEAIEAAESGEITILTTKIDFETEKALTFNAPADATVTIDAPNATLVAGGDLTFVGENAVSVFGTGYYNRTFTIGEGASLEITGTGRATLGYGNVFNITGTITDAKNTDKATVTPSLVIPGGISITGGNDAEMNVKNAYVKIGSTTSKDSAANGEFTLSFVNSIAEFTSQLTFSEPTGGNNPTFNLNIKDSVLTTGTKLIVAVPNTTTVIDNSTVTLGTYFRNSGNMTLKNESVLTGSTIQFGENGGNDGTTIVDNSTFNISATSAGHALDGNGKGEIILKNGAVADIDYVTKSAVSIEDATVEFAGNVVDTESVTFETPDGVEVEVDATTGAIKVKVAVVKMNNTPYYSLDEALDYALANNLSEIEIEVLDDIAFSSKLAKFKKVTFTGTDREQTFDLNINGSFEANVCLEFNDLTVSRLDKEWLYHYFYAKGGLSFNNCKMIGLYVVTAQDTDFIGCDFYNDDSFGNGNYSIWLYNCFDGVEVNVSDCTFDVYERAIKIYGNGYNGNMVLNISETEFVSRTADKTVVEMAYDQSTGVGSMDLNISESTAEGFGAPEHIDGEENAWFNVELGSGKNTLSTVKVDNEIVYNDCVAKIGEARYASLQAAIEAAAADATAENPVTVQLLAGEYEFGTVTLPVLDGVTIKGAANDGTVIKNTLITNAGAKTDNITDFTLDGIVFDNSRIYINGWTTGMNFADWTIKNCVFENFEAASVGGIVQFNLSSAMIVGQHGPYNDVALENFTFTGNVIDGAVTTSNNVSGINSQAMEGKIVIEGNVFNDISFNAIQLQNVPETATVSIKDNVFTNIGSQIIHLNNNLADIKVNENVFVKTDEDKLYISHLSTEIEASDNFYGIGTSTEDAVFDENYASKVHYAADVPAPIVLGYYTDTELTEYVDITVAKIGNDRFASLKAAFAAADDGDKITLVGEATVTEKIDVPVSITLDLNGKTITTKDIEDSYVFVVTDQCMSFVINANDGKIVSEDAKALGIVDVDVWADLTVNGGTYDFDTNGGALFKIEESCMSVAKLENIVVETNNQVLNAAGSLSEITVNGGTYNSSNDRTSTTNQFYIKGAKATFNEVTIENDYVGAIQSSGGDVIVNDCAITVNGTRNAPYLSMAVSVSGGGKLTVNGGSYVSKSVAEADALGQGTTHGAWTAGVMNSGGTLTINDGTFTNDNYGDNELATNARTVVFIGATTGKEAKLIINDGNFNSLSDAFAYTENSGGTESIAIYGGTYNVDPTAFLAAGYKAVQLADGSFEVLEDTYRPDVVEVKFAPASENEEEKVYNINIEAAGEVINRLNSADLTFVLTQGEYGNNKYQIVDIAGDNIAVNPVDDKGRYEFHFTTKTDVENDTAVSITIAQVKFTGYGKFSFAVDAAANGTNAVHTTTIVDNVVDTFVPNPDETENEGTLDIGTGTGALEIKVPTRKLTINVTFPNTVENKASDYQQMTVKISGDDLAEPVVIKLGSDFVISDYKTAEKEYAVVSTAFAEGAYKLEISELLIKGNTYNVEVSGAGYRTARYTVQMTENKVLEFWNNVKDAGKAIEYVYGEENALVEKSEKTPTTFLAGDIVNNGVIDIYDLSAVVSYFGEKDIAKYDLNRDGEIDSKDVAYVLVSWGN